MDFSSHAVWFQTHATLPWYNRTQRFALLQQPTTIMDQWPSTKIKTQQQQQQFHVFKFI